MEFFITIAALNTASFCDLCAAVPIALIWFANVETVRVFATICLL